MNFFCPIFRNSWLNDNRISITMKASLRVNIPDLSSSICCPVCHKFSLTAEACLEHLFTQCLYVENKDASLVRNWLCDYFSTKTEKKLNILKYVLSNYSASRILCKYCKTEAPDQESLMKHFPCPQRRFGNPNELMCEVCNFSVPDLPKLMVHMISKHYRCHACGIWPKNGKIDFIALKHHLKCCDPRGPTVFRCPLCFMDVPVEAEHDLSSHIANCKKVRAESEFDNRSLYGKCDILNCTDQILLCDVDAHMRKHLKKGDLPSSRQKRSRLSLDDLNNLVMHSFKDRRSSVCICNGNLRWSAAPILLYFCYFCFRKITYLSVIIISTVVYFLY